VGLLELRASPDAIWGLGLRAFAWLEGGLDVSGLLLLMLSFWDEEVSGINESSSTLAKGKELALSLQSLSELEGCKIPDGF